MIKCKKCGTEYPYFLASMLECEGCQCCGDMSDDTLAKMRAEAERGGIMKPVWHNVKTWCSYHEFMLFYRADCFLRRWIRDFHIRGAVFAFVVSMMINLLLYLGWLIYR